MSKICKGRGVASGHGCGSDLTFVVRGKFKVYNQNKGLCDTCFYEWRKNTENGKIHAAKSKINPKSKKRIDIEKEYSKIRKEFLCRKENLICPVTGHAASEIHHKMGRMGYADDWAVENNIPLLIDERFFLAVSRKGHRKIEENPKWAKENGYSLNRF